MKRIPSSRTTSVAKNRRKHSEHTSADAAPDIEMQPIVGIVMGSQSDWPTMQKSAAILSTFDVSFEATVVSAHRSPDRLIAYAKNAKTRGLRAIIAGAGGAAHLPGMLAAMTSLPVCGVPIRTATLAGVDSLLSIVQMPSGVPVATFAIGENGAANAAFFVLRMLSLTDRKLAIKLDRFTQNEEARVLKMATFVENVRA